MAERDLNLSHLRTFLEIVRSGSFTKAAGRVYLTQSAVSRQMKELEATLGTDIFERFGGGVQLTPSGRALVSQAEKLLLQAEETLRLLEEIEGGETGELSVGATITAANYFLPEILAAYRKKYPRVCILLRPGSSDKLVNQVRRNELDLAVVGYKPQSPDLKTWGTANDEVVMISHPDHSLAGRRPVSPEKIVEEDFILREPASDTRKLVEKWAGEAGLALRVLIDMW